jgi:putative membrane protein
MISIPTTPTDNPMDAYKKLNDKSGNDFDKAYADMVVSGHKDAIKNLEQFTFR